MAAYQGELLEEFQSAVEALDKSFTDLLPSLCEKNRDGAFVKKVSPKFPYLEANGTELSYTPTPADEQLRTDVIRALQKARFFKDQQDQNHVDTQADRQVGSAATACTVLLGVDAVLEKRLEVANNFCVVTQALEALESVKWTDDLDAKVLEFDLGDVTLKRQIKLEILTAFNNWRASLTVYSNAIKAFEKEGGILAQLERVSNYTYLNPTAFKQAALFDGVPLAEAMNEQKNAWSEAVKVLKQLIPVPDPTAAPASVVAPVLVPPPLPDLPATPTSAGLGTQAAANAFQSCLFKHDALQTLIEETEADLGNLNEEDIRDAKTSIAQRLQALETAVSLLPAAQREDVVLIPRPRSLLKSLNERLASLKLEHESEVEMRRETRAENMRTMPVVSIPKLKGTSSFLQWKKGLALITVTDPFKKARILLDSIENKSILEQVRGLTDYDTILKIVNMEFASAKILVPALLWELRTMKPAREMSDFRRVVARVRNVFTEVTSLGPAAASYIDSTVIEDVLSRFPEEVQRRWEVYLIELEDSRDANKTVESESEFSDVGGRPESILEDLLPKDLDIESRRKRKDFRRFLEREQRIFANVKVRMDLSSKGSETPAKPRGDQGKGRGEASKKRVNNYATEVKKTCVVCKGNLNDHKDTKGRPSLRLQSCPIFRTKKTKAERKAIVEKHGHCQSCLSPDCSPATCPMKDTKCKTCDTPHHYMICPATNKVESNAATVLNGKGPVRLVVGRAKLSGGVGKEPSYENVFCDNGSDTNLIATEVVKRHKLKGVPTEVYLKTLNSDYESRKAFQHEITIYLSSGEPRTILALEVPGSCMTNIVKHSKDQLQKFSRLFKIRQQDINQADGQAGLMIGACNLDLHPKLLRSQSGVALYHSRIGEPYWIAGVVGNQPSSSRVINANFVDVKSKDFFSSWISSDQLGLNTEPRCAAHLKAPQCKECKAMETPASFAEQQDAKIIRSNLKCDFDKRQVTVGLPWKRDPHVVFPPSNTNRHLVDKMARTLKRGLERDGMIETYTAAFQEAVDRGVYREASPEEIEAWDNSGLPSNYISHHPVLKPGSKTYKCRPVCNSSTPHAGTTLNDELRKGPNSLSNLHHVLLRSTQHPYLLIGDICRAYNSILVPNPVDQHARRLLWLSEDDLHKENPQFRHYLAQTACFGDRPSGYFLEEVKSQLSLWCSQKGPEWAEAQLTLSLYSYVDDLIRSLRDRALALDLMKKIPYVFEQLGFTLKPMILIGPSEEVAEDVPEETSLLGYIYSFRDDTYQINWKVNFSARRRSARVLPDLREDSELDGVIFTPATLLSLLASQYDPLGYASCFLIRGKLLLSKVHKETPGWKDPLTAEHQKLAHEYARDILSLVRSPVKFPRCVVPMDFSLKRLFVFADASSVALHVVLYAVSTNASGEVYSSFVTAKNTLAHRSVPNNELWAILAGNRLLANYLHACETDSLEEIIFLSDSECSLAQIKPDFTASDVYTRNKVLEIHRYHCRLTVPMSYFHIPSKTNAPADAGTRADTPASYLSSSEWQHGPNFIKEDIRSFPEARLFYTVEPNNENPLPVMDVESYAVSVQVATSHPLLCLLDRCSTLDKALRAVCVVRRFIAGVRTHKFKQIKAFCASQAPKPLSFPPLSLVQEELRAAFETLVRVTQSEFPVKNLNTQQLLTYFDEDKSITYTQQRCSAEAMKNLFSTDRLPVLAPKSRLATLVIRAAHSQAVLDGASPLHFGLKQTVVNTRSGCYGCYIVNSTQRCKGVIWACVPCRKQRKVVQEAQIGLRSQLGLPAPEDGAAFKDLVIDYFGPILTKMPKQRETRQTKFYKQYGMVIVCRATHAVNIIQVEDYSKEAFSVAFSTHCARHGIPISLTSDPMSAFRAAAKELDDKDLDIAGHTDVFRAMNIKWKILPPGSQWRTGQAEALVRSVKSMTRFLTHHETAPALTPGQYQMLFANITEILNRRPISYSVDDGTVNILSANSLLMGKSSKLSMGIGGDEFAPASRSTLVKDLTSKFWKSLHTTLASSSELFKAPKWAKRGRTPQIGDILLILYAGKVSDGYRIGRVTDVIDERTLEVVVSPAQPGTNLTTFKPTRTMTVAIQRTVLLYSADDLQSSGHDPLSCGTAAPAE